MEVFFKLQIQFIRLIHSSPLNNTGLNCTSSLKCRSFSVVNTIVLHGPWLNLQMWRDHGYRKLTINYMQINPHIVPGSTVVLFRFHVSF